jgi:PTH1 family peptidyl-tRNA hydrolase
VKAGGADYLLTPMRRMQLQELDEVLDDVVRAVEMILKDGVAKAMNEFNRRDGNAPAEK